MVSPLVGDAVVTPIPAGLRPRALNYVSANVLDKRISQLLFRAQHISFGIEASQAFINLAGEGLMELREELTHFAPHPFDSYTFSFFMGSDTGMTEVLCIVDKDRSDTFVAGLVAMNWGSENLQSQEFGLWPKSYALDQQHDHAAGVGARPSVAAWCFVDAFKVMIARPNVASGLAIPSTRRVGLSRGRRVNFYTASLVTIDLEAATKPQGKGSPPNGRQVACHGYRAHLCHSGGQRDCEHHWIEIGGRMVGDVWQPDAEHPRSNATWDCYHCGRRRWHRRAGERGSLAVGEVRQTYKVKKGSRDVVPT